MKIPFYQNEWLGINLLEISKSIGLQENEVANSLLYEKFYQKLKEKGFPLSQIWVDRKRELARKLSNLRVLQGRAASVLSIGAGLGIVEANLIKKGWNVDTQECQPYSISYMKQQYPDQFKKTRFFLSTDLSEIPSNSYDMILAVTSSYCLNDDTLELFLQSVRRLLKKGGVFIWYETSLTWHDIIIHIKSKFLGHPSGVLWGWKRSFKTVNKLAQKNGFSLLDHLYLDQDNKEISSSERIGLPTNKNVAWQLGIYQRD